MTIRLLLSLFLVSTFHAPLVSAAADSFGRVQEGEGGEVVVVEGRVVREVEVDGGPLPLLAVGSSDGRHYLYEPNHFAMQGVWFGTFGRLDDQGVFTIDRSKLKPFHLKRTPPWTFGEKPRRNLKHEWLGHVFRDGDVLLRYRLSDEKSGLSWQVEERLQFDSELQQRLIFSIEPSGETDLYLNYWLEQVHFKRVLADGQQNQRNLLKNLLPNQKDFSITFVRRGQDPIVPHGYTIETIAIPAPEPPFLFEPTDISFSADGVAYACTRLGEVWRRSIDGQWQLFAEGLHEANGVLADSNDGSVYVMQKPELTRLVDTDGDHIADLYETVEDRFRFSGHYHEFAYGPRRNARGELFFSTGLASSGYHSATGSLQNQMTSALGYRGWVMRRDPDGTITPFASGLRSPAGIGMNAADELFITDNQGDWVPSSYLGHVEQGDFLGHPASLWDLPEHGVTPRELDYRTVAVIPDEVPPLDLAQAGEIRKRPAVWLAHGDLTNSPGHPAFAPEEGFGPFGGQAFIADIAHRNVVRVALEKVDGLYQGAVFPFIRPLASAAYSAVFDPSGNLWIGAVGRGWVAGDPSIEMIKYQDGATPFEIQQIALTREGFDIVFTEPLGSAEIEAADISVSEYQWPWTSAYGAEVTNLRKLAVTEVSISKDRSVVSIQLPRQVEHIYEIQLPAVMSRSGLELKNNYGVYTLNRLLP